MARGLKWNIRRKSMEKSSTFGWICGTVMEYDRLNGYLVQFPDDVDWIPTLRSKDVRILE